MATDKPEAKTSSTKPEYEVDYKGRRFSVRVNEEHKSTELRIPNFSNPHMRAFHASWFGFFTTFFSTFAPAPLAPTLMKASTLNLTRPDIALGNIASVSMNIVCRLIMGVVADKLGPRKGLVFVLLVTSPAIVGIALVTGPVGFIICRAIIGIGLASFVACQVWCSQMFAKNCVGAANATAGGWGNLGGGITTLTMGFIYRGFLAASNGNEQTAWRLCFIVPFVLHVAAALVALSGRDLPDGNYKELELTGAKQKSDSSVVTKVGFSNVNAWILTITYALCFGVELTVTNVASQYFYEYHGFRQVISTTLASIFGLVNIFARSLGGLTSDWANRKFGMRGRIWALWIWQTIEGILCIVMGLATINARAPDFTVPATNVGSVQIDGTWVPFVDNSTYIVPCGNLGVELNAGLKAVVDPRFAPFSEIVVSDPSPDCTSNSNTAVFVVFVVFAFSIAVQMSEGLTYGIVPFVSRPALGVVSGMVGAGGNAGAVVTNTCFFLSNSMRTDTGLIHMGIMIIACTMTLFFVYFPDQGGMIFRAGAISYNPQLIKVPEGYKGSDEITINASDVIRTDPEAPDDGAKPKADEAPSKV